MYPSYDQPSPDYPTEAQDREWARQEAAILEEEDWESLSSQTPPAETDWQEFSRILAGERRIEQVQSEYTWTQTAPGTYLVESPSGACYQVRQSEFGPVCDCKSYQFGNGACKHTAALLRGVTIQAPAPMVGPRGTIRMTPAEVAREIAPSRDDPDALRAWLDAQPKPEWMAGAAGAYAAIKADLAGKPCQLLAEW